MPYNYNLRPLRHRVKNNSDENIIDVTIKLLNGKQYQLYINPEIKLDNFYKLVSEETNIHTSDFYFVNQRRRMPKIEEIKSWMTIKDFNFKNGIVLHLVLRLGGGMNVFVYNRKDWFIFE